MLLLQRQLRAQQMQQHAEGAPAEASPDSVGSPESSADEAAAGKVAYPMRPIGVLESCFSQRSGTPRQPLLVPAARARLRLRSALHLQRHDCLELLGPCPLLSLLTSQSPERACLLVPAA